MFGVSTSGYYHWLSNQEERNHREKTLSALIRKLFEDSEKTYGVDRICGLLRQKGHKASYPKVKALMKKMGLKSVHKRRRQRSLTDSRNSRGDEYQNLIKGLEITEPFQVITSDISYLRTGEGFEYLCKIKDVVSGIVLAHFSADNMDAELVVRTLQSAAKRWKLPKDCIFHSDRGSQYTSVKVKTLLKELGIRQSFSRVGKPGDNAWSESFFANLKKETVHWRHFKTRAEARQAIFAYIEGFYNTRRVQKRLGYLSPLEWLRSRYSAPLASVA